MFYTKYQINLDETLALKGISILVIILHNFIHRFPGVIVENQHIFSMERNRELITRFSEQWNSDLFLDLISHYGHYGVPVFVFLSGYGLVVKYENDHGAPIGFHKFIKRHVCKLWLLLLPLLVLHFLFLGIKEPGYFQEHWLDFALMTGFVGNLNPDSYIFHGPWWFFSLIMQLYVIYYVFVYRRTLKPITILAVICITVQAVTIGIFKNMDYLEYLRFNFVGSVLPFALGIIAARKKFFPTDGIAIVAFALFIVCCFNAYSWLLTFGLITVAVLPVVKLVQLNIMTYTSLRGLGIISSFLFVTHPIIRSLTFGLSEYSLCLSIVVYGTLSILFAWGYKRLLLWGRQNIIKHTGSTLKS